MKTLYVNGEGIGQAEKIVVTDTTIIGYNDQDKEEFGLRGVDFSNITYEIQDENGYSVNADKTEFQAMQETLDQLVIDSLS